MSEPEAERYELLAASLWRFEPTRRELLGRLGAGVLFAFTAPVPAAPGGALTTRFHIGQEGQITLLTGKVELGQGARTLLLRAAAEELGRKPEELKILMGDTSLVPDDGGTWASLTTPQTVPAVRQAAAALRSILEARQAPDAGRLTEPGRWQVLGKPGGQTTAAAAVTGGLRFTADLPAQGMLHGVMIRPPAHTARLIEPGAEAAARIAGVRVVREGDFLGITAPDPAAARQAVRLVAPKWQEAPLPAFEEMVESFRREAKPPVPPKPGVRYPALLVKGDAASALAAAPLRHEASYTVRPIAHVPLEPRAAIAEWSEQDGRDFLTVRGGVQAPFVVRQELAEAFRLPLEQVRVIAVDCGGAFGAKQRGEVFLEAARLARGAGKPVRLVWTREEEFTISYSRPAGVIDVKSGFDETGRLLAWEFHNYNSGASGLPMHYGAEHSWCGFHSAPAPLRQGSYRSLAAVANTFARESHMEEIAARLGIDPVEFRLRHTTDVRLREVIEQAAGLGGWGARKPGALGFAANLEKDARLALCVEAQVEGKAKSVKVTRAVMVFDPGAVLNPDHLKNQIEGAVMQGLGGALFEQIRWQGARFVTTRLSAYRVPRFSDLPKIEVRLIHRPEVEAAGAGESPITVVAPAIASAIFRAAGSRIRSLPLLPAWA